jgi:hypothetical protein
MTSQPPSPGQPGYVVLGAGNVILDSVTLVVMLNQGHETAKADQYYIPNMDRVEAFREIQMGLAAE